MLRVEDLDEDQLGKLMTTTAKGIEKIFDLLGVERPHYALVVFNDPKDGQYISNCERESMIAAMRETADRLEGRQDVPR